MDKENVLHMYSIGCVQHEKRKDILQFVTTWMDLEAIMLNDVSHTRNTNTAYGHLYEES